MTAARLVPARRWSAPTEVCAKESKQMVPLVRVAKRLAVDERARHPPPPLLLYGWGSVSWTYSSEPDHDLQAYSMYETQPADLPLNSNCWQQQ
mmetsp:Transcript_17276/g.31865  ORF Transcript_17276/g.31865 Transcript_17276/m.31865 type:complete len:93 (+) Transcript_17276:121-399(+)